MKTRKKYFVTLAALLLASAASAVALKSTMPAGYTVPVIDLAGDTARQVVVDRQPGQYLGHVTSVLLDDGKTIIAVYPLGHGKGQIVMKKSSDGGLTWSDRLPTPASWATSTEVPTIFKLTGPDEKERLALFSGLYPIRMSHSEDNGATWTELAPIGDFGGIVAMSTLVRLNDGSYLALFHDDGRYFKGRVKARNAGLEGGFKIYGTVSRDGGLTWGAPTVVASHPLAKLCEPGAVRSPDGKEIAVLLRENSRRYNSFVIFSRDEGQTWTEPRELPAALTGDRHTAAYTLDGRLFITFRDMARESKTRGDWVAWVGTYDDIARGKEGQYRVRLMDNQDGSDCGYAGLVVLPDGTIVTHTYGHWTKSQEPYIMSVRLKLSELDK